jgi:hypothetical protein
MNTVDIIIEFIFEVAVAGKRYSYHLGHGMTKWRAMSRPRNDHNVPLGKEFQPGPLGHKFRNSFHCRGCNSLPKGYIVAL